MFYPAALKMCFCLLQLVLTLLMTCVIIYLYTVVAFNFFRKFYLTGDEGEPELKCHNMMTVSIQCLTEMPNMMAQRTYCLNAMPQYDVCVFNV